MEQNCSEKGFLGTGDVEIQPRVGLSLGRRIEQPIVDQSNSAPTPGVIGTHPKPAVRIGNDSSGPRFTQQKSDRVFGAADASDDAD